MLHFAAARSHGRNALFQLLLETEINIAYRDELYRTARDISIQANIPENTIEIDRYILHIASNGSVICSPSFPSLRTVIFRGHQQAC